MSTIAVLALFLAYIIAPAHPITWVLVALSIIALTYDTMTTFRKAAH